MLIVIAVIAALGGGYAFYTQSAESETIKIVALYPLTGGVASWGESSQKATQIAVDEINKNGGINGKQIEVIYQDHKCDPKVALSIYQQFVQKTKIFTSSSCSGTVLSVAPNLEKDNALLLPQVVASVKISGVSPMVYRNWVVETSQAAVIGQKIKELGYKKIGIINEETDFGKGLAIGLQDYLKDSGVEVITESFKTGDTDVRTQLTKLKGAKVEALFIAPQSETSSETVLAQMEQLGFKTNLFVNDIILQAPKLLAAHAALLEGTMGGNFVIQSERLQSFMDAYEARYGVECAHVNACAIAYDSMNILADAIKAKGNSAEAVAGYLKTVDYSGVSGQTAFNEKNDRSGAGYLLSVIKGGGVELAK